MNCKHEQQHLMGTADGIVCRACGETFKTWADVITARGEKPVEAQETPETQEKPEAQETPKKRTRKKATE